MKELLQKARHEIIQLRRRNEVLTAQMDVVEIFAAALGLKRNQGGMEIDVAWELEQKLSQLEDEEAMKDITRK